MKSTTPVRHILRFRRWSRKAYAAFASIGRCVTIGCLPKSIADSSLAKQKSACTTTAEYVWRSAAEETETDIGIPIGSNRSLTCGTAEPGMNLQLLFVTQVARPCGHAGGEEAYTLKQKNYTARIIRTYVAHIFKPQLPADSCLFLYSRF